MFNHLTPSDNPPLLRAGFRNTTVWRTAPIIFRTPRSLKFLKLVSGYLRMAVNTDYSTTRLKYWRLDNLT